MGSEFPRIDGPRRSTVYRWFKVLGLGARRRLWTTCVVWGTSGCASPPHEDSHAGDQYDQRNRKDGLSNTRHYVTNCSIIVHYEDGHRHRVARKCFVFCANF